MKYWEQSCQSMVKYISQINGGLIMLFRKIFSKLVDSVLNNMERINAGKRNTSEMFKVPR